MLRFLEALNPCNFCFTVSDFDDALIDIQVILKNLGSVSQNEENSPLSPQEKKNSLEKAFHLAGLCLNATDKKKPDKQLSFLLADILRHYACLYYEENYFAAKQILLLSLNLHFYTIGISNECFDVHDFISLDDLAQQSKARPLLFYCIEQSILSTSMERCLTLAHTHSFMQPSSKKMLFSLAETVHCLGRCYQNIDQNKLINPENDLLFAQVFGLSESLHLLIDDESSKLALADLYCYAWPFMHQRKKPSDFIKMDQFYEKALIYDPSSEREAHISYNRFLTLFTNEKKSEALPYLQKALFLTEKLNHNKHSFFLSILYDCYATYLMEPETLDLDQAEIYLEKSSTYAKKCRAEGKDHLQFSLYDMHLAELKFVRGEFKEAEKIINCSLNTLFKHPQSQASQAVKAEALKSLITKALKIVFEKHKDISQQAVIPSKHLPRNENSVDS